MSRFRVYALDFPLVKVEVALISASQLPRPAMSVSLRPDPATSEQPGVMGQ